MFRRLVSLALVVGGLSSLVVTAAAAEGDLARHLDEQYKGKTFILRGFYSSDRLSYDSAGRAMNPSAADDWTVAGVVQVEEFRLSDARLRIKARRLHLGWPDGIFQELHDYDRKGKPDKDEKKNRSLLIEADLGSATVDAADTVLSQIFLSSRDNFADLVPDYWRPCILAASTGKGSQQYSACRFSHEFATVPGVVHVSQQSPEREGTAGGQAQWSGSAIFRAGKGIAPPKAISQTNPSFSEEARHAKYQGTAVLSLVVDQTGQVRNLRIVRPLGMGLDQKAVETVLQWRFVPATRDGESVAVEIAVETSFHLF